MRTTRLGASFPIRRPAVVTAIAVAALGLWAERAWTRSPAGPDGATASEATATAIVAPSVEEGGVGDVGDVDGGAVVAAPAIDGGATVDLALPVLPPATAAGRLPASLMQIPEHTGAAIAVDLTQNRMYVYRNGGDDGLQLVADHFVTIGKNGSYKRREGDEKTPVGVYFVTSWIPDQQLPELYGAGAFPVDYPNHWDRRLGRTGSGIWIHGMPRDQETRAPRSSRGCLSLNNRDLLGIAPAIDIGRTPVLISNEIRWQTPETLAATRAGVLEAVDAWRQAWQDLDTEGYLAFYAEDFRSGSMDRAAWARHKRRVNRAKTFIEVELEHVGVYAYPGEEGLVLLDFDQHYRSSNFASSARKRQYWRQTGDSWRIVHEGNTSL